MGVNGYVLAIIASDLFSVLFLFVATRLWNNLHFHKVDRKIKHDMLKYSVPLMPTIILWWIINVSDRYMVTGFVGSAENGLYTAASKIPNFVIMFSSIFIDAWQLSAVDEYDSDDKAEFFTKIFRIYSGGIFAVSSALILACQLITKILVADSYYESWRYVPVLIIATTLSCLVNFLASVYMAEKKSVMAMVTALSGALTNIVLNLVLIPLIGALGAAIATIAAFAVVFVFRGSNTRKYIKIKFNAPLIAVEVAILAAQCVVMLWLKSGIYMYLAEAALFGAMLLVNIKPIKELSIKLFGKLLRRIK